MPEKESRQQMPAVLPEKPELHCKSSRPEGREDGPGRVIKFTQGNLSGFGKSHTEIQS